jgi:predicted DNA-binding transcriptional regulator AlpA
MKLCSVKELKTVYGIPYSRQHIWRLQAQNEFPLVVKLGRCRVAFRVSDVEGWIADRISKSNQPQREHSL